MRKPGTVLLIIIVTLLFRSGVAASPSQASNSNLRESSAACWNVVPSANHNAYFNGLEGVAAISPSDVWAVGSSGSYTANLLTLAEHWDGSNWQVVASPNPSAYYNELHGVSAISQNDVWAVGDEADSTTGPENTLIEHWDGTNWSVVPSPNPTANISFLYGVTAIAQNNVWAVGGYFSFNSFGTLIEHWDGTSWSIVPSPNPGREDTFLRGVAAISANDIWTVGDYGINNGYNTLVEHWNGTSWSIVPSPNPSTYDSALYGVAAISQNNIWAVGNFYNSSSTAGTLVVHWDGSSWRVVDSPSPGPNSNLLNAIAALSSSDIWAVGIYYNISSPSHTLTEHWDGASWSVVASPDPGTHDNILGGVAAIAPTDVWSVGSYRNTNFGYPISTLVEHYSSSCSLPTPGPTATTCGQNYADVPVEYWAYGYIRYLSCRGIVSGYPDGLFHPNNNISRAEFSKMLTLGYGLLLTTPAQPSFSDVPPGYWAYIYIESLHAAGVISGYADGSFRPNASITRAELVKMNIAASGVPFYSGPLPDYPDVPPSYWAYTYIKTATYKQWVGGYSDGLFHPAANASRAELSKILFLALSYPRNSLGQRLHP